MADNDQAGVHHLLGRMEGLLAGLDDKFDKLEQRSAERHAETREAARQALEVATENQRMLAPLRWAARNVRGLTLAAGAVFLVCRGEVSVSTLARELTGLAK